MSFGNIINQFLNEHSFADTSTPKQTDLATTSVRSKEVDDLDTGFQHLGSCRLVNEWRRVGVNGRHLAPLNGTALINRLADDVHDTTESGMAYGDLDRCAGVHDFLPTDQTLGTIHGNGADAVLAKVSGDLEDETATLKVLDLKSIKDWGKALGVELDVNDSTNDRPYRANITLDLGSIRTS